MAYQITCPSCQQEGLDPRHSTATCSHCAKQFKIVGFCPACHVELERIQACGATDFFCNTCNELISKKQIDFHVSAVSSLQKR